MKLRIWSTGLLVLLALASMGQMTPEEAMRRLQEARARAERESGAENGDEIEAAPAPADDVGRTAAIYFNRYAGSLGQYGTKVGDQVYFNPNFNIRFLRTNAASVGQPRDRDRKTMRVFVGTFFNYTTRLVGGVTRTVLKSRRPVYESYELELDANEKFARNRSIGPPEPGEFGFIHRATVASAGDDAVELTDVRIQPDLNAAQRYRSLTSDEALAEWATREQSRIRRLPYEKYEVRSPDRFELHVPDHAKLVRLRRQMLAWEYEGRARAAATEGQWKNRRLVVYGVPTAGLQPGQPWPGADEQLAIVGVDGDRVIAVPSLAFRRPLTREELEAYLQRVGWTKRDLAEAARTIEAAPIHGRSTAWRLAFMLAGAPLYDDAAIAGRFPLIAPADPAAPSPAAVASVDSNPGDAGSAPNSPEAGTADDGSPPVASRPAPEPKKVASYVRPRYEPFESEVAEVFRRMPEAALPREGEELTAEHLAAANQWWKRRMVGRPLTLTAAYVGRQPTNGWPTGVPAEATVLGRFRHGEVAQRLFEEDWSIKPISWFGYDFDVEVRGYFDADAAAALDPLQPFDGAGPVPPTKLTGRVVEATFTENTLVITLADCRLD